MWVDRYIAPTYTPELTGGGSIEFADDMDIVGLTARTFFGPLEAFRSGSGHFSLLKSYRQSERLSADEQRARSMVKLNRIVRYAYQNCPFYTRRLAAMGYRPEEALTETSFLQIPLLTKADIQRYREDMRSLLLGPGDVILNKTGGSTGEPLAFYVDKTRMNSRLAATWRHNEWAGYNFGDKVALLWGARRDMPDQRSLRWKLRNALLDRTIWLNASDVSEESLESFLLAYNAYKPRIILAYAHTAYLFSRFVASGAKIAHRPHAIITTAEALTAHERVAIEAGLGAPVFDRYGCREVSVVASECEYHNGLHINSDSLLVEVLSGGRSVSRGEIGEVVITDLENVGMPLIRYQIRDSATHTNVPCDCGRTLPRLSVTGGRVNEFLVTTDQRLVAGTALTIFLSTAVPGLRQMQIVQKRVGEVLFRVVVDSGVFEGAELRERAREYLGDTALSIEQVESIPLEASGKYRFCISEVAGEFIEKGLGHTPQTQSGVPS